ncbi:MAG: hypothetical protein ACR2F6_03980 [Mycobacteriales bacterium]
MPADAVGTFFLINADTENPCGRGITGGAVNPERTLGREIMSLTFTAT